MSGIIEAREVYELAASLESTLTAPDIVGGFVLLDQLDAKLVPLIREINVKMSAHQLTAPPAGYRNTTPEPTASPIASLDDKEAITSLLAQLAPLIKVGDFDSVETIARLDSHLVGTVFAPFSTSLKRQIDDLNFTSAIASLHELSAALHGAEHQVST